jgi:hypothetical protein
VTGRTPVLGPTQNSIQQRTRSKAAEAWSWPLTSKLCAKYACLGAYHKFPKCFRSNVVRERCKNFALSNQNKKGYHFVVGSVSNLNLLHTRSCNRSTSPLTVWHEVQHYFKEAILLHPGQKQYQHSYKVFQ